ELYTILSTTGSVAWALVNKAGSSIADLQDKAHSNLTSIQGNGPFHLNATEQARVAGFINKTSNPTTSDIAAGQWAIYKNTTSGEVRLWANDGGTMKSVLLS
ncbi:MAG: hypothetical protein ACK5PF_04040, partial [bacterium]